MHYYAHVVLLVTLAVAATASRAESYALDNSLVFSNTSFDGDTIDLRPVQRSTATYLTLNIAASQVIGGGLTLKGANNDNYMRGTSVKADMSDIYVTDATITITGYMPHNTAITLSDVTAVMRSAKPVLALASLHLHVMTTLVVRGVTAVWQSSVPNAWVAQLTTSGERATILRNSGLYLLQVAAQNAAGVVSVDTRAGLFVGDNSAFAVDYASCKDCNDAVFAVLGHTTVKAGSVLRISNAASDTRPLLRAEANIVVVTASLFLLDSSNVTHGNMFDITSNSVTVTDYSAFTYSNLHAAATGLTALVPTYVQPGSKVYGHNCRVAGRTLSTTIEYKTAYLNVTTPVTADGRIANSQTCACAQRIPMRFSNPAASYGGCACTCNTGYVAPSCAVSSDPVATFAARVGSNALCTVPNCATCTAQRSECDRCNDGYGSHSDSFCTKQPSFTPATTIPNPDSQSLPRPQSQPAESCSPHCIRCEAPCAGCVATVCRACASGFALHNKMTCVRQDNGVRTMTMALAADCMLLLSAVAAYVL